jgi:hypothetical protein
MNERIKELALQAAQEVRVSHNNPYWRMQAEIEEDAAWKEKFAKLIIQRCIDEIETYWIPVGNSAAGELACEWTYDALKNIRDNIKEHFGIESK